jgi:hypothetical protein
MFFVLLSENISMKKTVFIFLLWIPIVAFSQHFNGGILAGGVVSQVDGDMQGGYKKFGYLGGAYVRLEVSKRSAFQMEMEYIQKGSRKNADSVNPNESVLRLHYLEIPILYQFSAGKHFAFEAGPAFDVLIGSTRIYNGSVYEGTDADPLSPLTINGILGAGFYFGQHLKATARINYSISSIRSGNMYLDGYRYIFWQWGQFNNVISLSLSWDFKVRQD